jgi:glycosyltransferase involved in cell wall biosynthesis
MAKRAVVGIPFNYDESWIGGTYYVKNLICALGLLPEAEQPDVWLISQAEHSLAYIRKETRYPHLQWLQPHRIAGIDKGQGRRAMWLSRLTPSWWLKRVRFDVVFPFPIDTRWRQTVCWIPDFQDKRMPEFFSAAELAQREEQHRSYFGQYEHLVFSSQSAHDDFKEFYPESRVQCHVMHFAVFDQPSAQTSAQEICGKYSLPLRYFYAPNQFWIHKNHDLVIRAVALLHAQGVSATVVFSGKEHDHRAPEHVANLKELARSLGVELLIRFVGFVPREDQTAIFAHAALIVQPSLFEGWSTVIEDAMSMGKPVIASRIPANVEQLGASGEFFSTRDPAELAALLHKYLEHSPAVAACDYRARQVEFARSFMRVVKTVKASGLAGPELE